MQELSKNAILEIAVIQLQCEGLDFESTIEVEAGSAGVAETSNCAGHDQLDHLLTTAARGDVREAILRSRAVFGGDCLSSRSEASIWQMRATQLCLQGDCPSFYETLREDMRSMDNGPRESWEFDAIFEDTAALGLFCPVFASAAAPAPAASQAHLIAGAEAAMTALGLPPRLVQLLSSENRAQALRLLAEEVKAAQHGIADGGRAGCSAVGGSSALGAGGGCEGRSAALRQSELSEPPLPSLLEAALTLGSRSGESATMVAGAQGRAP